MRRGSSGTARAAQFTPSAGTGRRPGSPRAPVGEDAPRLLEVARLAEPAQASTSAARCPGPRRSRRLRSCTRSFHFQARPVFARIWRFSRVQRRTRRTSRGHPPTARSSAYDCPSDVVIPPSSRATTPALDVRVAVARSSRAPSSSRSRARASRPPGVAVAAGEEDREGEEEPAGDPHARTYGGGRGAPRKHPLGSRPESAPLGEAWGERAALPSGCGGSSRTPGRVTAARHGRDDVRHRPRVAVLGLRDVLEPAHHSCSRPPPRTKSCASGPPSTYIARRRSIGRRGAFTSSCTGHGVRAWMNEIRPLPSTPIAAVEKRRSTGPTFFPIARHEADRLHERAVALRGALEILAVAIDDPDRRGAAGDGIEREHGAVLRHASLVHVSARAHERHARPIVLLVHTRVDRGDRARAPGPRARGPERPLTGRGRVQEPELEAGRVDPDDRDRAAVVLGGRTVEEAHLEPRLEQLPSRAPGARPPPPRRQVAGDARAPPGVSRAPAAAKGRIAPLSGPSVTVTRPGSVRDFVHALSARREARPEGSPRRHVADLLRRYAAERPDPRTPPSAWPSARPVTADRRSAAASTRPTSSRSHRPSASTARAPA